MLHKSAACRKQGNKRAHLKFSIFHSSNFNKLFVKTLREILHFLRGTTETSLKVLVHLPTLTIKWGPFPYL